MDASDHDLLISLSTKVDLILKVVADNHESNLHRISMLEANKADNSRLNELLAQSLEQRRDHERRIRQLEKFGGIAIGIILAIQFVFEYLL